MPYVISLAVAILAALALLLVLIRVAGAAKRAAQAGERGRSAFADRSGLLTARGAALRVELDRRRSRVPADTDGGRDEPHPA